jgi:hypothetical protein
MNGASGGIVERTDRRREHQVGTPVRDDRESAERRRGNFSQCPELITCSTLSAIIVSMKSPRNARKPGEQRMERRSGVWVIVAAGEVAHSSRAGPPRSAKPRGTHARLDPAEQTGQYPYIPIQDMRLSNYVDALNLLGDEKRSACALLAGAAR